MSITGAGGLGASSTNTMLLSLLSKLGSAQSTTETSDQTAGATASSSGSSSSKDGCKGSTGNATNRLSGEILALLVQIQMQQQDTGTSETTSATTDDSATGATATSTGTKAGGMTDPLSSLFSAMDTDGDSTVSQGEFSSYIKTLGGTEGQADTLYAQLTNDGSNELSKQQLTGDAMSFRPMGPRPPRPSSDDLASNLLDTYDTDGDGAISQSEFESAVSSDGTSTSEADQGFAELDTSGLGSLDLEELKAAIDQVLSSFAKPDAGDATSSLFQASDATAT